MSNNPRTTFELETGISDIGWCPFSVRFGEGTWKCDASWIDSHPIHSLIRSVVELYDHLFVNPVPMENAVWDCLAADEPGGIVIRATPEDERVRIRIYQTFDELWPKPNESPENAPVADGVIDFWDYADAVYEDAARCLGRQGITGLRNGWEPGRWDIDANYQVMPMEHFLYVAALVKNRSPKAGMPLQEEIVILQEIAENMARKHHE